jgi:Sulfotransferase family
MPMQNGNAWTGPLFIVGMPRSGTKLLRGLLNQHSRIRIPDIETDFLPFLARWVRNHGRPASEPEFAQLFAALKSATYFTLRRAATPFAWQAWRGLCLGRYDVADLFEAFIRYETGAARDSDCIWGDKSPAYVRHVALLLEQFPTARVVHIVRDVRDFCVSMRKTWNKDIRRAAFQWGRDAGNAHRLCMAHPERCIEVKYEELLQSPEAQMRRLSGFLGLEFCSAMIRLERPVEPRGAAAGATQIKQDNVRKFTDALTAREIRNVEALALDTMRLLGYQPLQARAQRRLSHLEERLLRVKDGLQLVTRAARRRGLAYALRFHVSHSRVSS